MSNPPEIPTLASLRRSASAIRRRPATETLGLLDALPDPPATPVVSASPSLATPAASRPSNTYDTPKASDTDDRHTRAPQPLRSPQSLLSPQSPLAPHPAVRNAVGIEHAGTTGADPEDAAPPTAPPPAPALAPWTVSGLVRHVRSLVEQDMNRITVEGEISNWRPAGSGHCYFTVKDAHAQLSAVMFRRQVSLLRFQPRDGDAVKLHGQLSVYDGRGQLQLIAEWMQQAGLGALLAEVQQLKDRLRREGVFDRKRPLPAFPRCIGVITSLHGAALRDIVKVCRRRHAGVQLLIYPAAVQGPSCPAEIAAGLRWFNAHPEHAEVVLVARGGGSWEDLHGFDHEQVARAIASCVLPVITGIGHATETTVADAAADACAPTPSAAAELLTAAQNRVAEDLARLSGRLTRATRFEILRAQQRFAHLRAASLLQRLQEDVNRRSQRLDELGFLSQSVLNNKLRSRTNRLRIADARLGRLTPGARLERSRSRIEQGTSRLDRFTHLRLLQARQKTDGLSARLEALSPLRVLDRGYALAYGPDGHLLRSAESLHPADQISVRLAQGRLQAQVVTSIPADVASAES